MGFANSLDSYLLFVAFFLLVFGWKQTTVRVQIGSYVTSKYFGAYHLWTLGRALSHIEICCIWKKESSSICNFLYIKKAPDNGAF